MDPNLRAVMTGTIQKCWGIYCAPRTVRASGENAPMRRDINTVIDYGSSLTSYTALQYELTVLDGAEGADLHAEIRSMARLVLDPLRYYKDAVAEHRANGVPVVREVVVVVNGEEREMTFDEFVREYGPDAE